MHDRTPSPVTANKGEWSELYVLFKVFADKYINAAGPDLKPLAGERYTFLEVVREDAPDVPYRYALSGNSVIITAADGAVLRRLDTTGLSSKMARIFSNIKANIGSSFTLPEMTHLMDDYLISKVKANSSEKTDILAKVQGGPDSAAYELGFSIKSHVGGAPTLINSSSHTNFLYEVKGFNGDITSVNSIEGAGKIRKRLELIHKTGASFEFISIAGQNFKNNLRFIDTNFPVLLAHMLLEYYSGNGSEMAKLTDVVAGKTNLDITKQELDYKVRNFLRAAALGMVPSKIWDTKLSAYGGYIVVRDDGSLVCYHLFNDDEFRDYLFKNTKFDTPSTSRYEFGDLFVQDGKLFMKLNLQVRFLK